MLRSWTPPSPLPGRIETDRTVIRPYRKGDGPAVHDAVRATVGAPFLKLQWLTGDGDVDDCVFYVERAIRATREAACLNFPLAVLDRDERTYLGGFGFRQIDAAESTAEIGYWLRGDRHRQGLATEAAAALLTAGFTAQADGGWGFRRITLLCDADNIGSRRVAEKLGMRLERQERAERTEPATGAAPARLLDSLGYAILAEEWDPAVTRLA